MLGIARRVEDDLAMRQEMRAAPAVAGATGPAGAWVKAFAGGPGAGVGAELPVATANPGEEVVLTGKGRVIDGTMCLAEVYRPPGVAPMLTLLCPRCMQGLRVPGEEKRIEVEDIAPPRPVVFADEVRLQTVNVSVRDKLTCPNCDLTFKITDNWVHLP
jgi:uncharacterized protein YbaR (Trm112 family)